MEASPELLEALTKARKFIEDRTIQLYFRAPEGNPVAKGTGTLFQIRDERMIVTAAHVVKLIREGEGKLGVFNGDNRFEHIGGEAAEFIDGVAEDLLVLRLDADSIDAVSSRSFVGFLGPTGALDLSHHLCAIVGYPIERTRMKARGLIEYGSYMSCSSVVSNAPALANFDPERHFLLAHTDLVDAHGAPVTSPRLEGISGCGVWAVVDRRGVNGWSENSIRLVGVETGFYERDQHRYIKATRWDSVWRLIFDRWPALRPRLNRISWDGSGPPKFEFS